MRNQFCFCCCVLSVSRIQRLIRDQFSFCCCVFSIFTIWRWMRDQFSFCVFPILRILRWIRDRFKFLFGNFLFTRLISSHKGNFKEGPTKKQFVQFAKSSCPKLKMYFKMSTFFKSKFALCC